MAEMMATSGMTNEMAEETKSNTPEPSGETVDLTQKCVQCTRPRPIDKEGKAERKWTLLPNHRLLCPKCRKDRYIPRSITLPLVAPISVERPDGTEGPLAFEELDALILQQASMATDITNFVLRELQLRDPWVSLTVARQDPLAMYQAGEEPNDLSRNKLVQKLPDYDLPDLYLLARERFPLVKPSTVSALHNRARSLYLKWRYQVVVQNTNPARARYPQPIWVKACDWQLLWGEMETGESYPIIRIPLGQYWVKVSLAASRRDFSWQLSLLEKIASGEAKAGELGLKLQEVRGVNQGKQAVSRRKRKKKDPNRVHRCVRVSEDDKTRTDRRVDVQIAVTFAKEPAEGLDPKRTMVVETSAESLYVLLVNGKEFHRVNDDQMIRLIQRRKERKQRMADDRRLQNARYRRRLKAKSEKETARFSRRMDAYSHQLSRSLVDWAIRERCGRIIFNVGKPTCLPEDSFCWAEVESRVAYKAQEHNITLLRVKVPEGEEVDADAEFASEEKRRQSAAVKQTERLLKKEQAAVEKKETSALSKVMKTVSDTAKAALRINA